MIIEYVNFLKGNGVIDFEEFKDMLDKTKSVADPDADLREAFKVFDLDGDGIITVINRTHITFL